PGKQVELEVEAALRVAGRVREHLREQGWPRPLTAHSGNGAHLVYGIDLPNDPDSTQLLSAFLQAIATRFSDAQRAIDTSVFNEARISKLYGTVVRKGDATEDQQALPEPLPPVDYEQRLRQQLQAAVTSSRTTRFTGWASTAARGPAWSAWTLTTRSRGSAR